MDRAPSVRRGGGRRAIVQLALVVSVLLMASGCAAELVDPRADETQENAASTTEKAAGLVTDESAVAAPAPAMSESKPVRLEIPSLGVDTHIIDLDLNPDGTLEVPPDGTAAGWYTGAPTPGELGPAVIAGHVDWHGVDGVFFDLRDLQVGADILVTREDGSRAVFSASTVEHFPKTDFPTAKVYGNIDFPGLRIITCGGSFDENARSYTDNVIAFAVLD